VIYPKGVAGSQELFKIKFYPLTVFGKVAFQQDLITTDGFSETWLQTTFS
jgi:hypothetical protein